jgi:hypothetical protein
MTTRRYARAAACAIRGEEKLAASCLELSSSVRCVEGWETTLSARAAWWGIARASSSSRCEVRS